MSSRTARPRGSSSNVFINYRREDSSGHAGRLFDALSGQFPGRLFMDVDTLEPGVDFVDAIEQAVGACEVLIVVIGREWLTIKNAAGRRRLDDPADYVRLEVEAALARNIRVIPVLVQDTPMPGAEELPPSISRLARRNAIELSDARWAYDVDRLAHTIQDILKEKGAGAAVPVKPAVPRARLLLAAVALAVAIIGLVSFLGMRQTPSRVDDPPQARQARRESLVAAPVPAAGAPTGSPARREPTPNPSTATSTGAISAAPVEKVESTPAPLRVPPVSEPKRKPHRVKVPVDEKPAQPSASPAAHPRPENSATVAMQSPKATITSPSPGDTVGSTVQVHGSVSGFREQRIFLCIRQGNGAIYPRGELFPQADGQWSIQLRSSKEKNFDILIVAASNKEASQLLSDQKSRDDGIPTLPAGASISSGIVAVKRQGKWAEILGSKPRT